MAFAVDANVKSVTTAEANQVNEQLLWDEAIAIEPPGPSHLLQHSDNSSQLTNIVNKLKKAYSSIYTFDEHKKKPTVNSAALYIKELDRKYGDGKKIRPTDADEEAVYQRKRAVLVDKLKLQETAFDAIAAFDTNPPFRQLSQLEAHLTALNKLHDDTIKMHTEDAAEKKTFKIKRDQLTDTIKHFRAAYQHVLDFNTGKKFTTEADAVDALATFKASNTRALVIRDMSKSESDISAKKITEMNGVINKLHHAYDRLMAFVVSKKVSLGIVTTELAALEAVYQAANAIRAPTAAENDKYRKLKQFLETTVTDLAQRRAAHYDDIDKAKFHFSKVSDATDALDLLRKNWKALAGFGATSTDETDLFNVRETEAKNEIRRLRRKHIVEYPLKWTGIDLAKQDAEIDRLIAELGAPVDVDVAAVKAKSLQIIDSEKKYNALKNFPITVISLRPTYRTQQADFNKLVADALGSGRPPTAIEQHTINSINNKINMAMQPQSPALQSLLANINGGIIDTTQKIDDKLDFLGQRRIAGVFDSLLKSYRSSKIPSQFILQQLDVINTTQIKFLEDLATYHLKNLHKAANPADLYDEISTNLTALGIIIPNIAAYKPKKS